MISRTTLDPDNQIEVPLEIREAANIKPGDTLNMEVRDGLIVLVPERRSIVQQLKGLNADIWKVIDVDEYIQQERDSWERD